MKIIPFSHLIISQPMIRYTLIYLFALLPIPPTMAELIEIAQDNISLKETVHGVPIINIAAPNQAGVSHNLYHQFNIGDQGVVLNNNTEPKIGTELAGEISSNPNLTDQPANMIINEVISANPSVLKGSLEVAGHAADVIVANPYGITCDGCGFVNTPDATLTSGKPLFDDQGQLTALDVTQGNITISGKPANANRSDSFSLISHAMRIHNKISARELTLIAGNNRVKFEDGPIVVTTHQDNTPQLAIDSSEFGGMYADSITLISTGQGVAINLANLFASDQIDLATNGRIRLNNIVSVRNLNVSGDELHLTGKHIALGDMTLISRGNSLFDHAQLRAEENHLTIKVGGQLSSNDSTISTESADTMMLGKKGTIDVHGHDLVFHNTNTRAPMIRIHSLENLTQNETSRVTARQLLIKGHQLDLDGRLNTIEDLNLSAHHLQGSETAAIDSQKTLTLDLTGESQWAGEMVANKNLLITGKNLVNAGMMMSMEDLYLSVDQLTNQGHLQGKNLHMNIGSVQATESGSVTDPQAQNHQSQLMSAGLGANIKGKLINHGNIIANHIRLNNSQLSDNHEILNNFGRVTEFKPPIN